MGNSVEDEVAHVLVSGDVVSLPATSRDRHQTRGS